MAASYIDANVLVRHLTGDIPDQAKRARAFLARIESGEITATLLETSLAEVVWVLSSKRLYKLPPARIRDRLQRWSAANKKGHVGTMLIRPHQPEALELVAKSVL